eukprot:scaffold47345_cov55-Phaeocystis_antarctica.AAC.2
MSRHAIPPVQHARRVVPRCWFPNSQCWKGITFQMEGLEQRQRALVKRVSQGVAAGVGDLGAAEARADDCDDLARQKSHAHGTRVARPSLPSGLSARLRVCSAGRRRKASARATSPASLMAAPLRERLLSRGMAPRPRAAASAEAPASPTCMFTRAK